MNRFLLGNYLKYFYLVACATKAMFICYILTWTFFIFVNCYIVILIDSCKKNGYLHLFMLYVIYYYVLFYICFNDKNIY